jgi:hypothetical protein
MPEQPHDIKLIICDFDDTIASLLMKHVTALQSGLGEILIARNAHRRYFGLPEITLADLHAEIKKHCIGNDVFKRIGNILQKCPSLQDPQGTFQIIDETFINTIHNIESQKEFYDGFAEFFFDAVVTNGAIFVVYSNSPYIALFHALWNVGFDDRHIAGVCCQPEKHDEDAFYSFEEAKDILLGSVTDPEEQAFYERLSQKTTYMPPKARKP